MTSISDRWKKWAVDNPDKANARMREWRARNPRYMLVASAKRRSIRDGLLFDLTLENCPEIPDVCPVAQIKLFSRNDGSKGPIDNSPTLDRIDPLKGYVSGNVRVISHKGNRWKSDMSIDDLERLLKYCKGQL